MSKTLPLDHPANKDKACIDCGEVLPPEAFPIHKHPAGYKGLICLPRCKPCHSVWKRQNHMLRTYNLTEDQYKTMLLEQSNQCSICGSTGSGSEKNRFVVDHCHTTGKVRGLLCWPCNVGIGMFKERLDLLEKVVNYLNK